jgi:hypothetical protein
MNFTNGQELDEILSMLGERHIMVEHRLIHVGMPERNGKNIETRNAKQAIIDWHNKQVEEVLDSLEAEFDRHAKSIGLWGMEGLVLDMLARTGNLSSEQKEERDAMVTERRALAVLHGAIKAERAKLKEVK